MKINLKKIALNSILATVLLLPVTSLQSFAHCGHCHNNGHKQCKNGGHKHADMKKKIDAMFTEIGVNCEQKQKIDAIMQDSKTKEKALHQCMHEKKKALGQYMMTPQATKEQALCLANGIDELHKQMHEIHINTFFEMKQVLTPAQQQKMAEYHQKHMAEFEKKHEQYHKTHGCPMD